MSKVKIYPAEGNGVHIRSVVAMNDKLQELENKSLLTVDNIESSSITTGTGLRTEELGDSVTIELSGKTEVLEFNVDEDASPVLTSDLAGELISITQTSSISKPMQFSMDAHSAFSTGQTFKISKSESYVNHYFILYYTEASGLVKALYPSYSCSVVRTDTGWDVETDGMLTRIAIVSDSDTAVYSDTSSETLGVHAFVYAEHPAVEFKKTPEGIQTLTIDLSKQAERAKVPFINKEFIEADTEQQFVDRVYILGPVNVQDHAIDVAVDGILESYETIGLLKIDSSNQWSSDSKRMAFHNTSSGTYVVFDETNNTWVLGSLGDHSTGYVDLNPRTLLGAVGTLPASFGNVSVDVNYEYIDPHYFSLCEPEVNHRENNVIHVSFAGKPQTGFILL
tara:strand:- start:416 stop:1597 length:1182 start_codon:yes stop_codon:yes gene_type:complete